MKCINANEILPQKLVEEIQKYIQGETIYIPKKDKQINKPPTEYKIELQKRNVRIYLQHLEGVSNQQLAESFNLAQSSIRRIIIEQREGYRAMSERIQTLLPQWNLHNEAIKQIYNSTWQIGDSYVLKLYSESESLQRNILINQHLDKMGIPVGRLLKTNNGALYTEDNGQYFFVSEKLKGSNIVKLKLRNNKAEMMGEIIANLHIAFKSFEDKAEFWENSILDEMNGWVKESLEKSGWHNISCDEYEEIIVNLQKHYNSLPVQLIHRDVHFGNFLFDKQKFSGYIDFDLSQKNIRILDLCYFVLSVLSEKEKFGITEEMWFEFAEKVFAGYNKILKLSNEEKQSAVFIMESIELLFLAFFESREDSALAENTYNVFKFIKANEKRITRIIR
ncbi:MAG: CD3324 family protein [Acutalibacteraceae bacterium]|nr:CD3324 family protein [Acutalibacteraceae bacterium]